MLLSNEVSLPIIKYSYLISLSVRRRRQKLCKGSSLECKNRRPPSLSEVMTLLSVYSLIVLCCELYTVVQPRFASAETAYSVKFQFIGGSRQADTPGVYGEKGVKSSKNMPEGRYMHGMCINPMNNNHMLVFGGSTFIVAYGMCRFSWFNQDELASYLIFIDGFWNDLWSFDGKLWTWISGSNSTNQPGVYGTVTSPENVPGARSGHAMAMDSLRNLVWVFGGRDTKGSECWVFC